MGISEQAGVIELAEQVAGVELAFRRGLVEWLGKLPIVEARAKLGGDWLGCLRTVVVAEVVVREA